MIYAKTELKINMFGLTWFFFYFSTMWSIDVFTYIMADRFSKESNYWLSGNYE